MHEHRAEQPRQIYASTASRRDRRRTRRRGRTPVGAALLCTAMLLAALSVIAAVAPHLS